MTVFMYDAFGQLAAEYTTAAPTQTGRRYLTADHLGSARAIWKTDGTADAYCDYTPFGSPIPSGIGARTALWDCGAGNTVKFTGKERDAETGLDYFLARYYSGAQGRFTAADAPFADQHPENPQSWNLYQYGYNNPLANVDLDGRSVWTKAAKVVVKVAKTGNAAAAFADNVNDFTTVIDSNASIGSRVLAGISLLSEAAPVSLGDVKDAGRLLGVVGGVGKRLDKIADGTTAANKFENAGQVTRVEKTASGKRVGDFTKRQKDAAKAENTAANSGTMACTDCAKPLQNVKSQKGVTTPANQAQVHHDPALKDGGSRNSKPVVVCPECHRQRHADQ